MTENQNNVKAEKTKPTTTENTNQVKSATTLSSLYNQIQCRPSWEISLIRHRPDDSVETVLWTKRPVQSEPAPTVHRSHLHGEILIAISSKDDVDDRPLPDQIMGAPKNEISR